MVKHYRPFSLAAAVTFTVVGLMFLFIPETVLVFFNGISRTLGLPPSPVAGANFYLVLAVAYMYLAALLAYLMYRHPEVEFFPLLLAHAKLASAALSLYLFLAHGPYLIYLANCLIDGMIGAVALHLRESQGSDKVSLIVRALQLYVPQAVKKHKLKQLFRLTADAFRAQAPDISGLSFDQTLERYALFTREQAERAIRLDQDLPAIKSRLHQNAHQLGRELRHALRVNTLQQAGLAFGLMYRLLGIELSAEFPGEVLITRCFFSRYYSAEVCQVISALDAGVAAGLSGGGTLTFDQRITEGNHCCRAEFVWGRPAEGECT